MFFTVGLLDFFFLGHLIGHINEEIIGEYLGQGIAVYLGGVSFFYTIGLLPLITGFIIILYCLYATKQVILSRTTDNYVFQERRLLFPMITHINRSSVRKIHYTNKGLRLRHLWVLIFIPMGIRILQFGIPLFGEHLAHDEILPTMMVLSGSIDILGALIMLMIPTRSLTIQTNQKLHAINFLPISQVRVIPELYQLETGVIKSQVDPIQLFGGLGLVIISLVGLFMEAIWGTDLSMVGITYGLYLLMKILQSNGKNVYFSMQCPEETSKDNIHLRELSFIDIVGIGLLVYLSTLEFIWAWIYFVDFNGLILIDLLITTVFWFGMMFWIFIYLFIPKITKLSLNFMKSLWKSDKSIRNNIILRILVILAAIIIVIIVI